MSAEATSKINATRMVSPLHALCLRPDEVVNRYFPRDYAITAPKEIGSAFPPLGCAHSIPGKNSIIEFLDWVAHASRVLVLASRQSGLLSDGTPGERRLSACWFRLLAETDFLLQRAWTI
jgi:hypothetical protein